MKIFHHNDLDGRCSAAIIAHTTNNFNKADFIEIDYVTPLPIEKVKENETVYFVDYSFTDTNLEALKKLLAKECKIIWVDHHHSSILSEEKYPELKNIEGLRIEGISGAALTYIWFYCNLNLSDFPNFSTINELCKYQFEYIPKFVQLVSDYDCWQWKYGEETEFFELGTHTVNTNPEKTSIWEELLSNNMNKSNFALNNIVSAGKVIKAYETEMNTWYRNNFAFESEICGHKCIVINKKGNSKMFGKKYYEYPLVVTFAYNGKGFSYSLFSSNPEVDCSKIAETFGGGGHKGAAGFFLDKLIF